MANFIELITRKVSKYLDVNIKLDHITSELGLLDEKEVGELKEDLKNALEELER